MQIDDFFLLMGSLGGTPVVVTDTRLDAPGPFILYANHAFSEMVRVAPAAVIGRSPRGFQGSQTERHVVADLGRRLRAGLGARGTITNYRHGEPYLCDVEIHPLTSRSGEIVSFAAFEREVLRRRGRPPKAPGGRFLLLDPDQRFPSEIDPGRYAPAGLEVGPPPSGAAMRRPPAAPRARPIASAP